MIGSLPLSLSLLLSQIMQKCDPSLNVSVCNLNLTLLLNQDNCGNYVSLSVVVEETKCLWHLKDY